LIQEGKIDKAREAALFCLKKIPDNAIPYDVYTPFLIDILFKVGEEKRAMEMVQLMGRRAEENLNYYVDKNPEQHQITVYSNLKILSQLASILKGEGKTKDAEKYEKILTRFENILR
jgi:hypothetical protein